MVLTSHGERIARIVPLSNRRAYLTPTEVLGVPQADAGLRRDLAELGEDDLEGMGPIR